MSQSDETRLKQSKCAEIQRRYDRHQSERKEKRNDYGNARRKDLNRLRADRLRRLGWDWQPDFARLMSLTPDECGKAVELTFREQVRCCITTIRCFDAPAFKLREFYARRKRRRDRANYHRNKPKKGLAPRVSELLKVIIRPMSVKELVAVAAGLPSFRRNQGRGRLLPEESRKQAVHRALNVLVNSRLVQENLVVSATGFPVRWVAPIPRQQTKCHR